MERKEKNEYKLQVLLKCTQYQDSNNELYVGTC